ncbi:MAG TPA: hypothetical protein VF008_21345 [Niastella sp.]
MKKTSIILHVTAILIGTSFALASSKAPKTAVPQYYKSGDNYYPAGIEGYDYICEWGHFSVCTYYFDEATQQYMPTKYGKITWLR